MSVFRPLNSAESNLFTIRCSFNLSSITSGSLLTSPYLVSPTSNNLPDNFTVEYDNSTVKKITVNCGAKRFTSKPSISITPYGSLNISNLTNGTTSNFKDGFNFSFVVSNNTEEFDLIITGPTMVGLTTGNSNKGWNLASDSSNVYSYLPIGIGTGSINQNDDGYLTQLQVNGGISGRLPTLSYLSGDTNLNNTHSGYLISSSINIIFDTLENGTWFVINNTDTGTITLSDNSKTSDNLDVGLHYVIYNDGWYISTLSLSLSS